MLARLIDVGLDVDFRRRNMRQEQLVNKITLLKPVCLLGLVSFDLAAFPGVFRPECLVLDIVVGVLTSAGWPGALCSLANAPLGRHWLFI